MLNYDTALERLEKPRHQTQKKIGHRTWLRKFDTGAEGGGVALQYYDTTILEYLPENRVVLRPAHWATVRKTRDKMNEVLPRGWRVEMGSLRHSKASTVTVSKRSETWVMLWSVPLQDGEVYNEEGCERLQPSSYEKGVTRADLFFHDAAETTTVTVNAFLRGELAEEGLPAERMDQATEREEVLRLTKKRAPSAALLSWMLRGFDLNQIALSPFRFHLYWRARFEASDPRPRTLAAKARQMEQLLLLGKDAIRLKSNSNVFFGGRAWLKASLEKYLFEAAGFDLQGDG